MGLDCRILATIEVGAETKSVCMYYWRKAYAINKWFFSRLPVEVQETCLREAWCGFDCPITVAELDALEADDCELACELDIDLMLLLHARDALKNGFSLEYQSDH